jgi:hypothetical protein
MQPTLMSDTYGEEWLANGVLNLNIANEPCRPLTGGCYFEGKGKEKGLILPPI